MAEVQLLLLRVIYSAPGSALLSRLLLFAAVYLGVRQLGWWLRRDPDPAQRTARRNGAWQLAAVLAVWAVASSLGYQGAAVRTSHLEIAGSAPARVSYGDTAHAPTIQVFTARGCGPCKSLEQYLKGVIAQGYAVQYIPGSLGDDDWDLLDAALCEADPKAGFERVFGLAGGVPRGAAQPACRSGVRNNEAVLHRLTGKLAFPTVVMPDGLLLVGVPSNFQFQAYLHAAAPLPPPAASTGGQPS